MQIRAPGEHGERLVRRIAAEIRALIQRMAGRAQKFEIGPVGVVHQQQRVMRPTQRGVDAHVQAVSEIIGICEIDGGGLFPAQDFLQLLRGRAAGQKPLGRGGKEPDHVQV